MMHIQQILHVSFEQFEIYPALFYSFNPDPTIRLTFWSVVLGRFFIGLGVIGTGQPSIQRYSTLKSSKSAQT